MNPIQRSKYCTFKPTELLRGTVDSLAAIHVPKDLAGLLLEIAEGSRDWSSSLKRANPARPFGEVMNFLDMSGSDTMPASSSLSP